MKVHRFNIVMIAFSWRGISHYHLTDFNLPSLSLLSTHAIDPSVRLLACVFPPQNFCSRAALEAQGSCLNNKYSEGYPGKRWVLMQPHPSLLTWLIFSASGYPSQRNTHIGTHWYLLFSLGCAITVKYMPTAQLIIHSLCQRKFPRGYIERFCCLADRCTFSIFSFPVFYYFPWIIHIYQQPTERWYVLKYVSLDAWITSLQKSPSLWTCAVFIFFPHPS